MPGITASSQIRMKTVGSVLRARMLFKQRDFKLKGLGWIFGKSLKIVENELKSVFIERP